MKSRQKTGATVTELCRKRDKYHVLPVRHYSGHSLVRNKTLWVAFAPITPQRRIFYSGDSGYGPHFVEISEIFKITVSFFFAVVPKGIRVAAHQDKTSSPATDKLLENLRSTKNDTYFGWVLSGLNKNA